MTMTRLPTLIAAMAASLAASALLVVPAMAQKPPQRVTAEAAKPPPKAKSGEQTAHRLVLQVDTNDPAAMNLALNNAANVDQYYNDRGEPVEIEIITFGP